LFEDKEKVSFAGGAYLNPLENRFSFPSKNHALSGSKFLGPNPFTHSLPLPPPVPQKSLLVSAHDPSSPTPGFKIITSHYGPILWRALRPLLPALLCLLGWAGQAWGWVNGDFEDCNLTGWTVSTNSGAALACGPPTATSVTTGWAPLSNSMLNMVHGGNCAAQLYSARGDSNNQDWARIEQTDTVPTNGDTCLSFWFAAVFEDHHYEIGQSADTYIEADVIVGGATVASLIYDWANDLALVVPDGLTGTGGAACPITPATQNRWGYLPWTNYVINLCHYAGQQVTVRFTDYDCGEGGHYGWGYVDDVAWLSCPTPPVVSLTKANNPAGAVNEGQTITYTLTYDNTGTTPDNGVSVTDMVPAGTVFVPNSQTSTPTMPETFVTGNQVGWAIGNLPPGASGTLSFQVTVDQSCVTISNQGVLTDLIQPCN
jgi:uncharacterized repeat protein (TIGR01451 family)